MISGQTTRYNYIKNLTRDPRYLQIISLGFILAYGVTEIGLDVTIGRFALIASSSLLVQYLCTRIWRLPSFDPRGALISSLSLALLFRADSITLVLLAATITISSKFVFRFNNKHIFNPANFGLVVMMLISDSVWVSPGQWGSGAFLGFLALCLGILVTNRARRSDVTFAFLGFYIALMIGRALWLGDPVAIPLHQLQNGALLIFAFYMISDPKTTPDSRIGRVIFALIVALGAFFVQFGLYRNNGLLWSLALCAFLTPALDYIFPAEKYEWPSRKTIVQPKKGASNVIEKESTFISPAFPGPVGRGIYRPVGPGLLRILRR